MSIFKISKILNLLVVGVLISGCSLFQRRSNPETAYENAKPLPKEEMQKYAADAGYLPNESLSDEQVYQIKARNRLRELERKLSSKQEREQYSKILPWLVSDEEKIAFLSIPSVEGRQAWIQRNQIWQRPQAPAPGVKEAIESGDIVIGMPAEFVKRSWGEPQAIDVSGNPIYKNERWRYSRYISSDQGYRMEKRNVYFEGGKVVGWDTE